MSTNNKKKVKEYKQNFKEKEIQMVLTHMKRCSVILIMREM